MSSSGTSAGCLDPGARSGESIRMNATICKPSSPAAVTADFREDVPGLLWIRLLADSDQQRGDQADNEDHEAQCSQLIRQQQEADRSQPGQEAEYRAERLGAGGLADAADDPDREGGPAE